MSANRKDNTTDGIVGLFNALLLVLLALRKYNTSSTRVL
jgi:hypothetical protein